MNVEQLITKLEGQPPDARVFCAFFDQDGDTCHDPVDACWLDSEGDVVLAEDKEPHE